MALYPIHVCSLVIAGAAALPGCIEGIRQDWEAGVLIFFVALFLGLYVQAWCCMITTCIRAKLTDRHPIAKLGNNEFRRLCEEHADTKIEFYDSVASGNCMQGTSDFRRTHFRGQSYTTLGALLPLMRTGLGGGRAKSIKRVIVYKLSKIERKERS